MPGHERFVRTMVAGASGIDMYLMCVAADDGVMPQTREHAAVLRHLGVEAGVVAVTKADAADPAPAAAEAAQLLPGATVVHTSARTGQGLAELLAAIEGVAGGLAGRAGADGPTRLHVDRCFTLRGIGTVATGTLWAGSIAAADVVEVLPASRRARVRSVQVHDRAVDRAAAGQRVAVALSGVGRAEVGRGHVLAPPGSPLAETYLVDAAVALEDGAGTLARGTRVQVHHGTREAPARVIPLAGSALAPGERGYAQLRLESSLMPAAGDRLVLRRLAPPATIGGAVALDADPGKHGPSPAVVKRLRLIEAGEAPPGAHEAPAPSRPAPERPERRVPDGLPARIAELLEADGAEPRPDALLAEELGVERSQLAAGLEQLARDGSVVRVGPAQHFAAGPLATVGNEVIALCRREGGATIGSVRDALGTSRKYAQAVLEHLDRTRVTRRAGDAHVLRRP